MTEYAKSILTFTNAIEACRHCRYAMPVPLEALPQSEPDPNQDSVITCMAPVISGNPRDLREERGEVEVNIFPLARECILSPVPNQRTCTVANLASSLDGKQQKVPKSEQDNHTYFLDKAGINVDY